MKKIACVFLAICTLFFAAACNGQAGSQLESQLGSTVFMPPEPQPVREILPGTNPLSGLKNPEGTPENIRPMAVMIDNIQNANPQRGISQAEVTYEMITEGGITRLMCVYSSYQTMPQVGPVRSARDQHVQLMIPMAAMYLHIGGSTYATRMLEDYGWQQKEIDGKIYSGVALRFDRERMEKVKASELCWYTSGELLTATTEIAETDTIMPEGAVRGPIFHFVPYNQPPRQLIGGDANSIYVRFSGYANSGFEYDEVSGRYEKFAFGQPHVDENTGKQLAYDNILLLFTEIKKYPDGILAKVDFSINGVGYYINGGRYEKIRWVKGSPQAPLRILSGDGTEVDVEINPGQSYIAFIDFAEHDYLKIDGAPETENAIEDPRQPLPGDEIEAKD